MPPCLPFSTCWRFLTFFFGGAFGLALASVLALPLVSAFAAGALAISEVSHGACSASKGLSLLALRARNHEIVKTESLRCRQSAPGQRVRHPRHRRREPATYCPVAAGGRRLVGHYRETGYSQSRLCAWSVSVRWPCRPTGRARVGLRSTLADPSTNIARRDRLACRIRHD